jgi:glycosyltransferase involved in cell wall biosynthesis
MLISLCIPIMNRLETLKLALPEIIKSANCTPPTEIIIVNYSSTDNLLEYLKDLKKENNIIVKNFNGARYYNSAHARNLCVVASSGEYILQLSADAIPTLDSIAYIRNIINEKHPDWMCEDTRFDGKYCGRFIVCKREEFIASGGYDERFNLYGPEDKDICLRLHRRGGRFETFPNSLISELYTPNNEKLANLDTSELEGKIWVKREMLRLRRPIFEENIANNVLVANPNGWGKGILE